MLKAKNLKVNENIRQKIFNFCLKAKQSEKEAKKAKKRDIGSNKKRKRKILPLLFEMK